MPLSSTESRRRSTCRSPQTSTVARHLAGHPDRCVVQGTAPSASQTSTPKAADVASAQKSHTRRAARDDQPTQQTGLTATTPINSRKYGSKYATAEDRKSKRLNSSH